MTTPDQQAAIERVRYWKLLGWQNLQVNGIPIEPGPADVLALLDAYDARGKEIETLQEIIDHHRRVVPGIEKERDALKAKLEAVSKYAAHRTSCDMYYATRSPCTCGLTAALESG